MRRSQQYRYALGCDCYLTLVTDRAEPATSAAFDVLWSYLESFDRTLSRFSTDSELSRFNRRAGHSIRVSPIMRQFLEASRRFAQATNGIYNPFTLPALQAAGYKGSWPEVTAVRDDLDMSDRRVAPIESLKLFDGSARIPKDTALDSGGIGKGLALDGLVRKAGELGFKNFSFSLGGDIICGGRDMEGPWRVGIADAYDDTKVIESIGGSATAPFAVATSSVLRRSGPGWNHLIDPVTTKPTDSAIASATVVAATATEADIWAKVAIIDTGTFMDRWADGNPERKYLLQPKRDGRTVRLDILRA